MRSIILGGSLKVSLNTTSTRYSHLQGDAYWSGDTYMGQFAGVSGTFSNLRVKLSAAPGAGKSYTFALMKNGAAQALTVTISGTNTTGEDTTHSFTVSPGDRLYMRCVPSGTPAAACAAHTVDFDSDAAAASLCMGDPGNGTGAQASGYHPVQSSNQNAFGSELNNSGIVPTAGKFKNFYIKCLSLGTTLGSITYTLRVNGVNTALAVTVTSAAVHSNTTDEVAVVAGDRVSIGFTNAGGVVAEIFGYGMDFEPDAANESIVMQTNKTMSNTQARYRVPCADQLGTWSTDEASYSQIANSFKLGKFYCMVSGDFTSGSYTLRIRKNGADTTVVVVIADPAQTGNDHTHSVSISDGDTISVEATPSPDPVPGAVGSLWGFTIDATGLYGAFAGNIPANELVKNSFM